MDIWHHRQDIFQQFLVSAYQHGVVLQIPEKETDRGNRTIYTTAKTFPCDAASRAMDENDGMLTR